ncbi:MAG: FG-GAP repeat domain-containing protein [Actinomycetes bacterium]
MSRCRDRHGRPRRRAARRLAALLTVGLLGCGGSGAGPEAAPLEQLTARPRPPAERPAPAASRPPAPAPGPSISVSIPTTPAGPSVAGLARFLAGFEPAGARGLDHVAVDLDGDGVDEAVVTWVAEGRVHVALVGWRASDGYAARSEDRGGRAGRVLSVRVGDLTGDGVPELVVEHGGDGRGGLSLWTVQGTTGLRRAEAVGGCADGHVYGVVGASLRQRAGEVEIVATCDDSPLPVADWSSDVYRHAGGAWRVVPSPSPSPDPGPSPGPSPTPGPTSPSSPGQAGTDG